MADAPLQSLLSTTYTKENFHRKVMLLSEFFSKRFFKEHKEESLKDSFRVFMSENNVGEALQQSLLNLPDDFFAYFTAENLNDTLKSLEEEVEQKPLLTLYVPTILPPSEVEKLGNWVRENIQQGLFLDLRVDAAVVGGCAFVWNGVHHDYSFKQHFEEKRNEIRNLVRSFSNDK